MGKIDVYKRQLYYDAGVQPVCRRTAWKVRYINEIKLINADVICLQEVSSRKLAERCV